jgi:hypothetical protein
MVRSRTQPTEYSLVYYNLKVTDIAGLDSRYRISVLLDINILKVGINFTGERWSLGRYGSIADSGHRISSVFMKI